MADTVITKLEGLDSLLAKLESISYDLKRKGGRSSLRKAAQVVQKAAQSEAARVDRSQTPESMQRNITLRWSSKVFKATGDLAFRVGVLGGAQRVAKSVGEFKGSGKSNPGGDTWYWRHVEFGTSKMKARPFMRPALEGNQDKATNTFIMEYGKAIDRAIKRAAKSGMRTTR